MNKTFPLVLCASILLPCTASVAAGSGEVTHSGTATQLPNAYAFRTLDAFDKKTPLTEIVFSSVAVDPSKLDAGTSRERAIEAQLDPQRAAYAEFVVDADGRVHQLNYAEPAYHTSGSSMDRPVLTHNDEKRIEGTFRTADEKKKTAYSAYFDLKFALDVAPIGEGK